MTVADTQTKPVGGGAHRGRPATTDPAVEAVLIAAPARFHAGLVVAAAEAGKAVSPPGGEDPWWPVVGGIA